MKFKVLLMLCFIVGLMSTVSAIDNTYYSGVETYTFQNGYYPDANYTGIELATIYECTSATDYSKYNYGDSIPTLGFDSALGNADIEADAVFTDDIARTLFKVDISSLPDSFIITEAKVKFRAQYTSSAALGTIVVGLHRVSKPWTEGTANGAHQDFSCSYDTAAVDVAWLTPGLNDVTHSVYGISRWNKSDNDPDAIFGTDSVYAPGGEIDRTNNSIISYSIARLGAAGAFRSFEFDITEFARNWHGGKWENDGFIMISSEEANDSGYYVSFFNDEDLEDPSTNRPIVTIKGILVQSSTGGTGSRSLGGKSGL